MYNVLRFKKMYPNTQGTYINLLYSQNINYIIFFCCFQNLGLSSIFICINFILSERNAFCFTVILQAHPALLSKTWNFHVAQLRHHTGVFRILPNC